MEINDAMLTFNDWDARQKKSCPLCLCEQGQAYSFMKKSFDVLAARGCCPADAAEYVSSAYDEFVRQPLAQRGVQAPMYSRSVVQEHFEQHDHSTAGTLRRELQRTRRLLDAMPVAFETEHGTQSDAKATRAYSQLLDSHVQLLKMLDARAQPNNVTQQLPAPPDIDS